MIGPQEILPNSAARYGSHVALITPARTMTYTELNTESERVAAWLNARGVEPGQSVTLYSENRWEWIVAYHGALKAGAVVNPANVMLTPEELAYVLRDCGSSAVFTSDTQAPTVVELTRDLPALRTVIAFGGPAPGAETFDGLLSPGLPTVAIPVDPKAPCTIGYTSGTTGYPKGAVQSHQAVLLNCALTATMHGRTEHDVVVSALPAPHVYGNVVINGTFLVGGTVVLMERFNAAQSLRLIETHRATMFEGVPAMYAMLLADPALPDTDLSSLTRCTVGGQTMPMATIERWQTRSGARLIELWGMTEISGLGATHALHAPALPGSVGVPLPGIELRIGDLDDPTRDVPHGQPGELMVRGAIVMMGYHGKPAETAKTIEPDGWLHTGDIATVDETGHVFIVDRLKDMIITGGFNVYPAEIERVLARHPAVAVAGVGPVPDQVKGEIACAYVVLAPGTTTSEQALIDFTAEHLAAYKRPRQVQFVEDLPTTSSGKIMRRELIKQYKWPAQAADSAGK